MKAYIVSEYRKDLRQTWYVAARPGYMRLKDGSYTRDGSFTGGPEWTTERAYAFEFASRLAAARVRSKCPGSTITEIE